MTPELRWALVVVIVECVTGLFIIHKWGRKEMLSSTYYEVIGMLQGIGFLAFLLVLFNL